MDELVGIERSMGSSGSEEIQKFLYDKDGNMTSDGITGLCYLRARYYSPGIGRFTQADSYHGDGMNLYVYAGNNPVRYVDPSGFCKCVCPQRTELAQEECQRVVNVGNAIRAFQCEGMPKKKAKRYIDKNPVTSIFLHKDGTVSVGISGAAEGSPANKEYAMTLQNALNESAGYNKYTVYSSTDGELLKQITIIPEGGNMRGVCAEPKAASAAHKNKSPIVGMYTRYYTIEDVPHRMGNANQMKECKTCEKYMEVYIKYANEN